MSTCPEQKEAESQWDCEAARKKGALDIHRMDTEMKAVILSHAQFQRREQPDAKLKRRARRLKGTVRNQANMHGAPLALHPPFSAAPGQCLSCRPAKTVVSCHGAPGRTGTGACLVPSRRNPPILVECLLFSFFPALSPSTSLFTTSPFSFPSPSHSLSSRFGTPFTHQWECEGRTFRPRNRTTPKDDDASLPLPSWTPGSLDSPGLHAPPHDDRDAHDASIDCRPVGKHRDPRGSGLPVHRLGSPTRGEERRGRSLLVVTDL